MSDNRSRHDRLAVRLSLIISRLMTGESLSLKTLSDEFGVTERPELFFPCCSLWHHSPPPPATGLSKTAGVRP